MKNVRSATINTDLKGLFSKWLLLTKPFHSLTGKEQSVLSLLLYQHHILRKEVSNELLLWKLVFDYDTKVMIRKELNMKDYALQNLLSLLRRKGAIKGKMINPSYIPILTKDVTNYKIIFNINVHEER